MTQLLATNNLIRGEYTNKVSKNNDLLKAVNRLRDRLVKIKNKDAIKAIDELKGELEVNKLLIQRHFTEVMRSHREMSSKMKDIVLAIYGKEKIEEAEGKAIEDIQKEIKESGHVKIKKR